MFKLRLLLDGITDLGLSFFIINLLILSFLVFILYIGRRNKKNGMKGLANEIATSQKKLFISTISGRPYKGDGTKIHEKAQFILIISSGMLVVDAYLGFPSGFNAIRGFFLITAIGCAAIVIRHYLGFKNK